MDIEKFCLRYCLDARSFEEKNARSMALAYERLLKGKTGQATRLFAYNHALNQNRKASEAKPTGKPSVPNPSPTKPVPKPAAKKPAPVPAAGAQKWKMRLWKAGKVVKTLTVDSDKESVLRPKIKALGIEWDKATLHDPKTMKTVSKFSAK